MARSLLVARQTVLCKLRDMENAVRTVLRESGLKVGSPGRKLFSVRVRELAEADPTLTDITEPLLAIIATMYRELERLTRRALESRVDAPSFARGFSNYFSRLGASIARVSGLLSWPEVRHGPVCSSKNRVHIGSESLVLEPRDWFSPP